MNSINIKDIGGKYLTVKNEDARRQLEQYAETGTMVTESDTGKTYKAKDTMYYAWIHYSHAEVYSLCYTLSETPEINDDVYTYSDNKLEVSGHVENVAENEITYAGGYSFSRYSEGNVKEVDWEEVGTGGSENAIEVVDELPDNPPVGKTIYLIQDGRSAVLQYQEKYYYAYHNSDQNMTLYTTTQNFNWDMLLYYDNGNEIVQYNKDYGLDYLDSEGQYFDCELTAIPARKSIYFFPYISVTVAPFPLLKVTSKLP